MMGATGPASIPTLFSEQPLDVGRQVWVSTNTDNEGTICDADAELPATNAVIVASGNVGDISQNCA